MNNGVGYNQGQQNQYNPGYQNQSYNPGYQNQYGNQNAYLNNGPINNNNQPYYGPQYYSVNTL